MQLSPHSLSKSHWNHDTEVPEEINPQQCGEWEQVYYSMRVINECLCGRRRNGNTLTGKQMGEPTIARMKTAAQPGASLSQEPGMLEAWRHQVECLSVGGGTVNCGGTVNRKTACGKAVPILSPTTCINAPLTHPWSCRRAGSLGFSPKPNSQPHILAVSSHDLFSECSHLSYLFLLL